MSVHIQLDRPHAHFTNLDFITGRVLLRISYSETIAAIVVKLEGESKTRLVAPAPQWEYQGSTMFPREQGRAELEVHKLLYKTEEVFPTPDIRGSGGRSGSYTLSAGQYEYPFRFKIPFNNECSTVNSRLTNLNISGVGWELARDTHRHVKKTLPPSLNGFPDQAEIRYYVKVTVQRPSLFKENFRDHAGFRFFPIEPPRPAKNQRESYARKQHAFAPAAEAPSNNSGGSLFGRSSTSKSAVADVKAPTITMDGRLPDPAIATCNEPLPLRILVNKINDSPAMIYLKLLDIKLIASTNTRAHGLMRTDDSLFAILSKSNLRVALTRTSTAGSAAGTAEIDPKNWDSIPLPNTIAPSFDTCNVSRSYTVEIKAGFSWGTDTGNMASELAIISLRMPLKIYSGIAPPPQLLAAMSNPINSQSPSGQASMPVHHQSQTFPNFPQRPSYPTRPPSNFTPTGQVPLAETPPIIPSSAPHYPPGQHQRPQPENSEFGDAPPSYEDAMADELAPVSGPRRDYAEERLAEQRASDGSRRVAAQGQGRNTGAV